jgi:hypothetical protein
MLAALLALAACAGTVREARQDATSRRAKGLCVLEVQPETKVVTLAEPDLGAGTGATSLFVSQVPAVAVGDLVDITRKEGSTEPTFEVREKDSAQCAAVVQQALHHHHGRH